jgi:hypothetical protein
MPARGGNAERGGAGADPDCDGAVGRGGSGSGGRRATPGAAGGAESPGRLVTSRESLGRGTPRGGSGGTGCVVRGGPNGSPDDAGRVAGSSGGRGAGADSGAGAVTAGEPRGSDRSAGMDAAGASGETWLAGGVAAGVSAGSTGATVAGPSGSTPPARGRPLTSGAGSSGCLSRRSPSRSTLRRTRSAWASSMLDEWLVTPMPRPRLRSNASLLVRPSSRASSYTRIFLAKSYVNPFLGPRRRRSHSLSSHVLELSIAVLPRLLRSRRPEKLARRLAGGPPVRGIPPSASTWRRFGKAKHPGPEGRPPAAAFRPGLG